MRARVPLVAVGAACLLASCGGGGSSESDQITSLIQTAVKSDDPADCQRLLSQKFMEQTSFESGQAAVASCEKDAKDTSDDPTSVDVSDVKVKGKTASASVAMTGGTFDGQTLVLALTKDGSSWKVDEITDIPDFNVDRFAVAFEAGLSAGDDPLTAKQAHCVGSQLAGADPANVKQVLLGGDASPLIALIQVCVT